MTSPVLRQVVAGDWTSLNDLHRWAWFPQRSERGWQWLHSFGQGYPGWVLEDEQGVCGYLGNIRQNYTLANARFQAATGYSLIVLPRAKGGSKALLDAFRSQPGVFATSIFNGNDRSAAIYEREGFSPFPEAWANAKIVWPLAPMTILSERVARLQFRDRRPPRELFCASTRPSVPSRMEPLVALDPWLEADSIELFHEELCRSQTVVADRSAAALQRRFSDPDQTVAPVLFGWKESGRLSAIALGQTGKLTERDAPILDVIDIAWIGPDGRSAAVTLLSHLKTLGRRSGASRMRLSLVNNATAAVAGSVPGRLVRRRHVHAYAHYSDAHSPTELWRPTPYDGDFAFCLRAPPVAAVDELPGIRFPPVVAAIGDGCLDRRSADFDDLRLCALRGDGQRVG
ncbi:MAG TPA: hypothetical protein VGB60_00895 [Brevundimonas sp.]|uniref:hypothetical protein n=1 Tax=Brevundimonas sp. TaxID=1871086 RepID=UPI002ED82BE9